ncbi:MAG: drug/metabolite transporter (DMT)-like permease, partial [Planctomycetota bacterium]
MGGLAMDRTAGFAPFAVASWRIGAGALVLLPLTLLRYRRRAIPARRDFLPLALFAFLGIVLNQGLFLVGLQKSTPMNAGLVICLIPVFAYSVAVIGRRETFHPRRALGVMVA